MIYWFIIYMCINNINKKVNTFTNIFLNIKYYYFIYIIYI